jgi:hypothetical protein
LAEFTVNVATLTPLMVTEVAPVKLEPVMVTTVPPEPLLGEKPVIVGRSKTSICGEPAASAIRVPCWANDVAVKTKIIESTSKKDCNKRFIRDPMQR